MPKALPIPDVRLDDRTVIVTGANTGIGKETARELARKGARVIMACRNLERAEEARADIVQDTGSDNIVVKALDLGSLRSVKEFADDINSTEERIDILVNNAGVFTKDRRETSDGIEMMFGVNHIGHFYLTNLLLDKLKASVPSRIIIVSSLGHKYSKVNLNDLEYKRNFKSLKAYCRSKTANILHCVQLARNLEGSGVTVYSLHPGTIKTELARDYENSFMIRLFGALVRLSGEKLLTPSEGAKTTLYCCLDPNIAQHSGGYYVKCKEARAKRYATDKESARKLWEISEVMCSSHQ